MADEEAVLKREVTTTREIGLVPYRDGEALFFADENIKLKREVDELKQKLTTSPAKTRDVVIAQVLLHTSGSALAYSLLAACTNIPLGPHDIAPGFFDHPYLLGFLAAANMFSFSLTWAVRKFGS